MKSLASWLLPPLYVYPSGSMSQEKMAGKNANRGYIVTTTLLYPLRNIYRPFVASTCRYMRAGMTNRTYMAGGLWPMTSLLPI